ncbi:hypothetical protein DFP73DRAFT_559336 [Morchella snyderi]|nr:hypothetical protein DFP73DRAFT_559336 [Morchella snyderi]
MTIATTLPANESSTPIFVYGSLMSPKILYGIIGRPPHLTPTLLKAQMAPATLHAYKRYSVQGADFPAVAETGVATDSVCGFMVTGLTEAQKALIDSFEGYLYTSKRVKVVLEGGESCWAGVYVWAGGVEDFGVKEWSFEAFKMTRMYSRWGQGE